MAKAEKKCWQFISGSLKSIEKLPRREQRKFRKELAQLLLAFTEARLEWVKSGQSNQEALYKMEETLESLKLFPLRIAAYLAEKKTKAENTLGEIARGTDKLAQKKTSKK